MPTMSRVVAVAPVLPPHRHTQTEITATIGPLVSRTARPGVLDRLHAGTGVRTRSLALPLEGYAGVTGPGAANAVFLREGTTLAVRAARRALDAAGLDPADVDLVLFTTVTGVSAPSIDALMVEPLGLRPDVRRLPSFGLGCAAGAAGLARVHDHLVGHPDDVALLVSVELCSLTLQHGDDSIANIISSGLFGDGGAAVVVVGEARAAALGARPAPRRAPAAAPDEGPDPAAVAPAVAPRVIATRSVLVPGTADQLGWDVRDTGFRIVLAPGLPDVIATHLEEQVRALLEPLDLKARDVARWVVHAGGPKILDAVQGALDLDHDALALSRASLADVGNLSSASVLHVLAATLAGPPPEPGSVGVVLAFGPGVGVEMVLLRWEAP